MNSDYGNFLQRGTDRSATIGASRGSGPYQDHNTPRPSYLTLSSEYSVATAFAVETVPPTATTDVPPVPQRPVHVGYEQGSSLPIHASQKQADGLRVVTRKGKTLGAGKSYGVQARDFAAHSSARHTTVAQTTLQSPVSDGSFEIVAPQEARTSHYDEAEAKLNGTWSGCNQHSPPWYMNYDDFVNHDERADDIVARRDPRDRAQMNREVIPVGSIAAAFGAKPDADTDKAKQERSASRLDRNRLRHELQRGVGPETSFNVAVDDAVLIPDASAVPYASSSPQARPAGMFRSSSRKARRAGSSLVGFARRGSDASRAKITHVPGSFKYDERVYPNGVSAVNDALPLKEAQRLGSHQPGLQPINPPRQTEAPRYPHALPPRTQPSRSEAPKATRSPHQPSPAKTAQPQPQPRPQRKVKVVGEADRQTLFGDFINYADSDSEKSVEVDRLANFRPMTPPPVPTAANVAPPKSITRKPTPKRDQRQDKSLPPLPAKPEGANDLGIPMPDRMVVDDSFDDEDDLITQQSRHFPEYVDEVFDDPNGITRQVDRMNLSLQDKQYAVTEAQRLKRRMMDQPPPGATGVDYQDYAPTMTIDTVEHPGHTSWRVTDTSKQNEIHSYYKQIQRQPPSKQVQSPPRRDPDEAADLMARLEREKYGAGASGRTGMSRRR